MNQQFIAIDLTGPGLAAEPNLTYKLTSSLDKDSKHKVCSLYKGCIKWD